jgi:hypothetical protein
VDFHGLLREGDFRPSFMNRFPGTGPLTGGLRDLQIQVNQARLQSVPGSLTSVGTQGSRTRPRLVVLPRRQAPNAPARWA